MCVDDCLFFKTSTLMPHSMAASIEAPFFIFCAKKDEDLETSFSMNKYFQTEYSYQRIQMGRIINTRNMVVCLTDEKKTKIQK